MTEIERFKRRCRQGFGELLPVADQLIREQVEVPDDWSCDLRFCDLGLAVGKFALILHEGGMFIRYRHITLNAQLIRHPDAILPTLRHEFAHYAVESIKAMRRITARRGEWSPHGKQWKAAARALGDDANRCHRIPLLPSKFKVELVERLPDGRTRPVWLTTTAKNQKCAAMPDVIEIRTKDSEGFWRPLPQEARP